MGDGGGLVKEREVVIMSDFGPSLYVELMEFAIDCFDVKCERGMSRMMIKLL